MTSAAAAHLEQAANAGQNGLPAHIARAQAARPKLTLLDGEMGTPVAGFDAPLTLLSRALNELNRATFRGGDAEVVTSQFLHLEWIMRTAMLRSATLARYGGALASVRRRSVFDWLTQSRHQIASAGEVAV